MAPNQQQDRNTMDELQAVAYVAAKVYVRRCIPKIQNPILFMLFATAFLVGRTGVERSI